MIVELNHVGITVRDLPTSLDFYSSRFDAKEVFRGWIPASRTEVVYLAMGQSLVELLHPLDPAEDESFGLNHIAFMTNDLEADFARLIANGVSGLSAPRPAGTGIGRLAFVQSPGGVRVELIQRDLPLRGTDSTSQEFASTVRFAIETSAVQDEVHFFRDLLGMSGGVAGSEEADDPATRTLVLNSDVLVLIGLADSGVASRLSHIAVSFPVIDGSRLGDQESGRRRERSPDPDGVLLLVD